MRKFLLLLCAVVVSLPWNVVAAQLLLPKGVGFPVSGDFIKSQVPELGTRSPEDMDYLITSYGTDVVSPIYGKVFFAGYIQDYGPTVIIKNESKLIVLSHLENILVFEGQRVMASEKIAHVPYHRNVLFSIRAIAEKKVIAQNNRKSLSQSHAWNALRIEEVRDLLQNAGFDKKDIPMMLCIAQWESGRDPLAINYNKNNTVDIGIFQINSIWLNKCHVNTQGLYDARINTKCALTVLNTQGFNAWVTYRQRKGKGCF